MKKIKLAKEEDKDQKTLVKEYKRLEIFIIIFMVIAICLGTFYFNVICFGPECENKSPTPLIIINTDKTNTNSGEVAGEEQLTDWMDYILKQNIQSISIDRSIINETEDGEENKNAVLTKEDLIEIFEKIKNAKITKGKLTGLAAVDSDTLNITYVADNITYDFKIYCTYINFIRVDQIKDANLISIFDKNVTETDTTLGDTGLDVYIFNNTSFTSIMNKYFN